MSKKLKFIDLFCGLGGFRIAFESNGCECVFSSDIDANVAKIYEDNFKEKPKGDITKIETSEIPEHDILCAGFPCQAFSIAGRRLGFEDTRGTLFFDVARILKDKKPKAFILENVKGITNHDKGKTLEVILNTLSELNYDVTYKVLNAKDYNIPQHRERWYCIGIRKDLKIPVSEFKFPEKQELEISIADKIQKINDEKYKVSSICTRNINHFIKEKNIKVDDVTLAYEIRPSKCQFKQDGTSPCLTAKMGTGGNNIPVLVSKMRRLTEKECLSIMGYSPNYKIGSGQHAYKQIGNSVVVPLITLLSEELVRFLSRL